MSFAPFTFVQVSDSHARANGAEWRARVTQILAAIAQLRPSPAFVLHTGDLMDEPSAEAAQAHRALFAGSPFNFLVNLLCGLIAYCHQPKKPSLHLDALPQLPA